MKVKIGKHKTNRKVEIFVDDFDTFSLDNTLAKIIYPSLVAFKKARKRMPGVPIEFFDESSELDETGSHTIKAVDEAEIRFLDAIDKMIWSMREIAEDYPGESQFFLKNGKKWKTVKDKKRTTKKTMARTLVETGTEYDVEGHKEYNNRINEGVRLFGEHFRSLWW